MHTLVIYYHFLVAAHIETETLHFRGKSPGSQCLSCARTNELCLFISCKQEKY